MSPPSAPVTPDRITAILAGLDHLDPATRASGQPSVEQVVKQSCAEAGWSVSDSAVAQALTLPPVPENNMPTLAIPPRASKWRRWGSFLWKATRPDLIGVALAAAWCAKVGFGADFIHLLGTTAFSSVLLLLMGVNMAWTILQGTWHTAQSGEPLGQKWSSLWTPLHILLLFCLLIPEMSGPLGQPISLLAKALLALFS
jgi:hypothetical protein